MALDGNINQKVGNLDAFSVFFKIIIRPTVQPETQLQALKCIQDIIYHQFYNIICVDKIGGISSLFEIFKETGEIMVIIIFYFNVLFF